MQMPTQYVSVTPAKGVRGIILVDAFNRRPFFRVYRQPEEYRREQADLKHAGQPHDENAWEFDDYEIAHYDFDVLIEEEHAALYVGVDGRKKLDYDLATLTPSPNAVRKPLNPKEETP